MLHIYLIEFYFLLYAEEESIQIMKIYHFWFLIDFHILECFGSEHDLAIFGKCVCEFICDRNFLSTKAKTETEFHEILYLVVL